MLDKVCLQPNKWSCGPTALRNALLRYGDIHNPRELIKLSRITKHTVDTTPGLKRAASKLGYLLHSTVYHRPEFTKDTVRSLNSFGVPVLLCVDRDINGPYQHWICAIKSTKRHVWICDSQRPGPPVLRLTWKQFLERACVWVLGDGPRFDLFPLYKWPSS